MNFFEEESLPEEPVVEKKKTNGSNGYVDVKEEVES